MSMDKRIDVQNCMYGCHSDLDKYRKDAPPSCNQKAERHILPNEKACEGCARQEDK